MSTCDAELCPNWTGHGCICEVLDLPKEARWGICRHCGDHTEQGDDPAPTLCVMCEIAGRTP